MWYSLIRGDAMHMHHIQFKRTDVTVRHFTAIMAKDCGLCSSMAMEMQE